MSRPTDWSALDYDKDPTPGDPSSIRELANHVRDIADSINESLGRFNELNCTEEFWKSEGAEGFKELKGALPEDLGLAQDRYENVAEALDTWLDALSGVQSRADDALRRANEARDDLAYANSGIEDMEEFKENAERTAEENGGTPAEWTGQDYDALKSDAEERLSQAKEDVGGAVDDRDTAADEAGRKIEDAADDKLKNKPWWRKALGVLSEILTWAAAIVGFLALFIPILAPLAAVLALASLLVTAILFFTGDKSWVDLGLEILGVLTLGVGKLAVRSIKLAQAGKAMLKANQAASKLDNLTRLRGMGARMVTKFKHPNYLKGSRFNPITGKFNSGAAMMSRYEKLGRNTVARMDGRMTGAMNDLHGAALAYDNIRYPSTALFKSPASVFNELKGNFLGVNGTAGQVSAATEVGGQVLSGIQVGRG